MTGPTACPGFSLHAAACQTSQKDMHNVVTAHRMHQQSYVSAAIRRPLLPSQGELASSGPHQGRRVGALQLAKHVISSEGPLALYSGLSPALVRHVFYTGTRISVYEQLREWWKQQQEQQQQAGQGQVHSIAAAAAAPGLAVKLAMGLTAGAAGQLVAVPADLVKVCS